MQEVILKVKKWIEIAAKKTAEFSIAEIAVTQSEHDRAISFSEYESAVEAQKITQVVAETIQQEAHNQIAGVVSQCLSSVFDDPYEFKINFERARGKTEANLVFIRDGEEINPIDSSGGGVIDVAAFALRISCLMLTRPQRRRVVVLDEPFRFVSQEYRPRVRTMLIELSKDLNIQFIMITHIKELAIGKVIDINDLNPGQ